MNCTRVEMLLPLYVGGDLAVAETEQVRAHLVACTNCQAQAAALAESQTWLQQAPLPEFSEDFFADLRADVWRELEQTETQPHWYDRWLPIWDWRWAGAAALAMVLLALAWNWFRLPGGNPPQEIANQPTPVPALRVPEKTPDATAAHAQPERKPIHRTTRPNYLRRTVVQQDVALTKPPTLPSNRETLSPVSGGANTDTLAATPEMTRIEFQTADPNIRIIWFAPKVETHSQSKEESNSR